MNLGKKCVKYGISKYSLKYGFQVARRRRLATRRLDTVPEEAHRQLNPDDTTTIDQGRVR